MKTCVSCQTPKEEDEFNWRYKALGIRQSSCRECQHGHQRNFYASHQEEEKERTRRRKVTAREEAREYVRDYLSQNPCVDCGESNPVVLDFDHVRGKSATINQLIRDGASIDRIEIEIGLTEVRCSNCHRKKTASENKWFKSG